MNSRSIFTGTITAAMSIAIVMLSAVVSPDARATEYPTKPIKIVVPFTAGGSTDSQGRLLATKLSERWGQPAIVENRPGAGGLMGQDFVAKAAPDGYTILIGITTLIQAPYLYQKLPYDAFKDLTPVSLMSLNADVLAVPSSSSATTLQDFIKIVKENPKKFTFGSYGNATSSHIHGEMLNRQAGTDMVHVPYKGSAPLMTDLLGGQISSAFIDGGTAREFVKSGKIKLLASSGSQRTTMFPNIPTLTELGFTGFEPYGFFGVFVPAGTPKDVVTKLATEVARIVREPDVSARIAEQGLQAVGSTPEELANVLRTDSVLWGKAIKDANIKIE